MNLAAIALATALALPGAITLHEFAGFETGSHLEEIGTTRSENVDVVTASPAPHSTKETYVCKLGIDEGEGDPLGFVTTDGVNITIGDYLTFGWWAYFDGIDGNADMDILIVYSVSSGTPFDAMHLSIEGPGGDLIIKDDSDTEVGSADGIIANQTWYLIEFKVPRDGGGSDDAEVRVNEAVVISIASEDFTGTVDANAETEIWLIGPGVSPTSAADIEHDVDSYYYYSDDGATISTNDAWLGEFTVLGPYNDTDNTTTSDFGDNLNAGSWLNVIDTPKDLSDMAEFSAIGSSTEGGCTSDDGANAGPKGDSRVLGTIMGASWYVWARKQQSSSQTWEFKYGANNDAAVDNTTNTGTLSLTTAYQLYSILVDNADANCPTKQEWFQYGMHQLETGFGKADLNMGACWAFILHQEERDIVLNGQVFQTER